MAAAFEARIATLDAIDPVLIWRGENDEGQDVLELRIGEVARGQTRYAVLTPEQAHAVARALAAAAEVGADGV